MTTDQFLAILRAIGAVTRQDLVDGGVIAADDDGAWVDFSRSPIRWLLNAKPDVCNKTLFLFTTLAWQVDAEGTGLKPGITSLTARVDELLKHNNDLLQRYRDLKAKTSGHRRGIYIASKTKHAWKWKNVREGGVPIISTWIDEAGAGESKDLSDLWVRCIQEASTAAAIVVYREPDDVLKGAWSEVGAALAAGVPVFGVGISDFTISNHPDVTVCDTISDAFAAAAAVNPTSLAA